MRKNLKHQALRYDKYEMSIKEYILYGFEGAMIISLFGYFFYRSVIIILLSLPLTVLYIRGKEKKLCEKRKRDLQIQFKDMLISVNGSVRAGYSLENAFVESYKDMVMYHGEGSIIAKENRNIINGLKNGISIIELIFDMGERSNLSDIKNFAGILSIGKRAGGRLSQILDEYIRVEEEKVSTLEEIETIISAQKYEQKIMNIIPFFIILYVEVTSKGFFNCLYSSFAGRLVMTGCLLLYLLSIYLSSKITDIKL